MRILPPARPGLNRAWISAHKSRADLPALGVTEELPERVIQFGEGNFLRAFADWQIHRLNCAGLFRGSVVVIQPLPQGRVDTLNRQDGLFTLWLRGLHQGKPVEQLELITAVRRGINPYQDWPAFTACAANPSLRFLISNTTEAGIVYQSVDRAADRCPDSFPAKVTEFLYRRYRHFNGASDKGMVLLPCELIEQNGDELKRCVLRHALDWSLDRGFLDWLDAVNHFCNTLVDRIVPGYPKTESEVAAERLGYDDDLLVVSEWFLQWVIQGSPEIQSELPFAQAGLKVIWTEDIRPYRTLKVRILNGIHTLLSAPALLSGQDTVRESVEDSVLSRFVQRGLAGEILPTLDFDESTKQDYAREVLERFRNPFIQHHWLSIMLNSVSKFKVRVLPTLLGFWEQRRMLPPILTFSLAALLELYRSVRKTPTACDGSSQGRHYPVSDDAAVVQFFQQNGELALAAPRQFCVAALAQQAFWDRDLTAVPGLCETVGHHLDRIRALGMAGAIREMVEP